MHIIIISILAGICGMGLGGVISAILGARADKMINIFLSFTGGVMTSIVIFELIPDAYEHSNSVIIIIGLALGVLMVLGLNYIIDKVTNYKAKFNEIYEQVNEIIINKKNMIRSGMLMFFVIGLHNIPEGFVIGVTGNYDLTLGITLALMISIHNIPLGMAISAPLILGGMNKWKAVLLTLLSGATTVVGALAGVLIGGISDTVLAISFSLAGGAMLYVVFIKILPQSMNIRKSRVPTIAMFAGIVFGLLLTRI